MSEREPDAAAGEARRWIGEAEDELRIARYLTLDESLPARAVCFHAHLAAEKALKGLLLSRSVTLRRLHDLVALHALLPVADQERFIEVDLDDLNGWTIDGRYPSDTGDVAAETIGGILEAAVRVVMAARGAIAR